MTDQQLLGCQHQPAIVETDEEREARRARQSELLADTAGSAEMSAQAAADYPGAKWVGAYWQNYTIPRSRIRPKYIAIHAMLGSLAGTRSWFNDPSNPYDTSCQYGVGSKGEVEQYVREAHYAHHVRGFNEEAIGIEHEDHGQYPKKPWATEALYNASAKLCAYLCKKYAIPIDRQHIKAHIEFPGNDHKDPNPYWDWSKYIALVKKYAGESGGGTGPWASWVNLAVASDSDAGIARAAESALQTVGFSKVGVTRNVEKAFDDAIKGALGEFPCVLIGRAAWEKLPSKKRAQALSDAVGGVWYSPDISDAWNAVGDTEDATKTLVAGHLSRLCERMGLDEKKAMKVWAEELSKRGSTPVPAPTPTPTPTKVRSSDDLFGPPRLSKAQCLKGAIADGAHYVRARLVADAIWSVKEPDSTWSPDVRFAQSFQETGGWRYGGDSVWANLAGVKKSEKERGGPVGDEPADFLVPKDAVAGAHVQANHARAYSLKDAVAPVHGRYSAALAAQRTRGYPITRISQLGSGIWATDPNYAAAIRRHLARWGDKPDPGSKAVAPPPRTNDAVGLVGRADQLDQIVRARFGVGALTYQGHGYAGVKPGYTSAHAVDFGPIGRWGEMATGDAKKLGDEIADFLALNAEAFGLHNIIWHERMWTPGSGWKPYNWRPYYDSGKGSRNVNTHRHGDHLHIQPDKDGLVTSYREI